MAIRVKGEGQMATVNIDETGSNATRSLLRPVLISVLVVKMAIAGMLILHVSLPPHLQITLDPPSQD